MMRDAMLRAIVLLCLIAGSQQILIKQFTFPNSVEEGSEVELTCVYEVNETNPYGITVKWWRQFENGQREQLYQWLATSREPPESYHNYSLGSVPNSILIKNAEPSHSGIYECEVSNLIHEMRRRQKLIVYSKGTGPNVTLTEVEDGPDADDISDVLISCAADDVTPEAELIVSINKKEVKDPKSVAGSKHDGLYDYRVNITVSKSIVKDAEVSCELFYKNLNITHPPYVSSLLLKEEEREDSSGESVTSTTEASLDKSVDNHSGSANLVRSLWVPLIATLIPCLLIL